jgi:hypothetical protein
MSGMVGLPPRGPGVPGCLDLSFDVGAAGQELDPESAFGDAGTADVTALGRPALPAAEPDVHAQSSPVIRWHSLTWPSRRASTAIFGS